MSDRVVDKLIDWLFAVFLASGIILVWTLGILCTLELAGWS